MHDTVFLSIVFLSCLHIVIDLQKSIYVSHWKQKKSGADLWVHPFGYVNIINRAAAAISYYIINSYLNRKSAMDIKKTWNLMLYNTLQHKQDSFPHI